MILVNRNYSLISVFFLLVLAHGKISAQSFSGLPGKTSFAFDYIKGGVSGKAEVLVKYGYATVAQPEKILPVGTRLGWSKSKSYFVYFAFSVDWGQNFEQGSANPSSLSHLILDHESLYSSLGGTVSNWEKVFGADTTKVNSPVWVTSRPSPILRTTVEEGFQEGALRIAFDFYYAENRANAQDNEADQIKSFELKTQIIHGKIPIVSAKKKSSKSQKPKIEKNTTKSEEKAITPEKASVQPPTVQREPSPFFWLVAAALALSLMGFLGYKYFLKLGSRSKSHMIVTAKREPPQEVSSNQKETIWAIENPLTSGSKNGFELGTGKDVKKNAEDDFDFNLIN